MWSQLSRYNLRVAGRYQVCLGAQNSFLPFGNQFLGHQNHFDFKIFLAKLFHFDFSGFVLPFPFGCNVDQLNTGVEQLTKVLPTLFIDPVQLSFTSICEYVLIALFLCFVNAAEKV